MWCVSAQQQKLNERTKSAKHSGRIETICFDMEIQLHIITLLNTNKLTANVFDVCIESERLSFCNYMYGNIIIIWLIDVWDVRGNGSDTQVRESAQQALAKCVSVFSWSV